MRLASPQYRDEVSAEAAWETEALSSLYRLTELLADRARVAQNTTRALLGVVRERCDTSRALLHAVHRRRQMFFEEFVQLVRRTPSLRRFAPLMGAASGRALSVETENRPEGHVIRVAGEIDLGNIAILRAVLDPAVQNSQNVIMDLSQVSYLDSTTLHAMLTSDRELSRHDRRLVVIGPPFLFKLIQMTGLQHYLIVVQSMAAVARALGR